MIQEQTRSATIYEFPVGGRDGLKLGARIDRLPQAAAYAVGESWYHAEAVEEAKKAKPQ